MITFIMKIFAGAEEVGRYELGQLGFDDRITTATIEGDFEPIYQQAVADAVMLASDYVAQYTSPKKQAVLSAAGYNYWTNKYTVHRLPIMTFVATKYGCDVSVVNKYDRLAWRDFIDSVYLSPIIKEEIDPESRLTTQPA